MKQIAEIKRIAKALTASSPEDMSRHLAYRTLKTDIPRLCDALEWTTDNLKYALLQLEGYKKVPHEKVIEGSIEKDKTVDNEIAKILEGK